ncbi:MAG: hypothetical protein ACO3LD_10805 [Luminiphilus sp.]
MPELSPAAQAVLDAAIKVAESPNAEAIAAAALEAAADQVVPEEIWLGTEETCYAYYCQRSITRRQLLAIAAELKAHD